MPRKAKDEEVKEKNKKTTITKEPVEKKAKKSNSLKKDKVEVEGKTTSIKKTKKTTTSSKTASKASSNISSKSASTKTSTSKKSSTSKAAKALKGEKSTTSKAKKTTAKTKAASTLKATKASKGEKATTSKAKTTTAKTKATSTSKVKKTTRKKATTITSMEYYDLPTFYNRTIVKILAQTPFSLFVYWEVSEDDKKILQKQYGEYIFQDTKPYLIITNETMNYSFEVEINDYANSWYVRIQDSSCKYNVQLVRKSNIYNALVPDSVINIISSNEISIPNDHILFDKLGKTVFFRNVKNDYILEKEISSLSFISNIGRVYNIYDLYKEIYKNELNGDELGVKLSSSSSSTFL